MPNYHWPVARIVAFVLFVILAVYALVADPVEIDIALALLGSGLAAWTLA